MARKPQQHGANAATPNSYSTFGYEPVCKSGASQQHKVHPEDKSWCFANMMLSWTTPLMTLGNQKQLDVEDIWSLQDKYNARTSYVNFDQQFQRTKSIPLSFLFTYGWRFMLTGVYFLVAILGGLFGPVALNRVISAMTATDFDQTQVLKWIVALFIAKLLQAICGRYANFISEVIAIQFTGALKSMIYEKSLRLSSEARKDKSSGTISNMYTSDSDSILIAAYFVHQTWLVPLQITAVIVMLFVVLGKAALAGLSVIMLLFGVNHVISTKLSDAFEDTMKARDARMKDVSEVFKGISIVKFNTWEEKFLERVGKSRKVELEKTWLTNKLTAASIVLMWGLPVFICIISFGFYVLVFHYELTAATVFTSLSLFQQIQGPLRFIADIIAAIVRANVSVKRVTEFMQLPELDPENVMTLANPESERLVRRNVHVAIENGSFGWEEDSVVLKDVNLEIKEGEFVVLHGKVGCGKSSLCSILLGEMTKKSGTVFVGGNIAYCSQQPWIQNMTIRENILFGKPYDPKKYQKVLEACALARDLTLFDAGDHTEIGERGANLSGGQKARISLARACYSDADLFVLDSPLAAVDAIVQNEIFQKCFLGLLRNKTILLVTHNPEIIESKYVSRAITVNDVGTLSCTKETQRPVGYEEAPLVSPLPFYGYKRMARLSRHSSYMTEEDAQQQQDVAPRGSLQLEHFPAESPMIQRMSSFNDRAAEKKNNKAGKLVAEEERSEGRVGTHVFVGYYHAVGGFVTVFTIVAAQTLWQTLQISSDFWLGQWSTKGTTGVAGRAETAYNLGVYAALGLAAAFMVFVRVLMVAKCGLDAAKFLFDSMTKSLMFAPMRFFDANPIGRILNRYGGDVAAVDRDVPFAFGTFFANIFAVGCSLVTATVVIQWYGLSLLPVVYLYIKLGTFYLQPARELQRLSKTTQSPQLSHISESFDGVSIVRAFGRHQVNRFRHTNDDRLDQFNKVWYAQLCVSTWFSLRIQLLGCFIIFVITYSLVLLRNQISVGVIGVAFSYALQASDNLSNIIQAWSRIETVMVSPERLHEYIDIPQEAERRNRIADPSSEWPQDGAIAFEEVNFRYKENDPLVLKGTSFNVRGREKVGIVGRTGAGKSSLTMALFRINELASGAIKIDGVNIAKIGLKSLREKISIIPQIPVLFKGTLRGYLDPFGNYEDEEIWTAIKRAGLYDRISSTEGKLDCTVEENGENFSVGERQMLCMARALLRKARIVILDEATAAIDHETDQKLQQVIQEAFADATVLTIAHRLDTILHCDRILVMDAGKVVEFETPSELVKRGKGHFFELMKEGGYLEKVVSAHNSDSE